jgi:hypothetical protein
MRVANGVAVPAADKGAGQVDCTFVDPFEGVLALANNDARLAVRAKVSALGFQLFSCHDDCLTPL